jgi:hypothetical protein
MVVMSVIPPLNKLRKEGHKFRASLYYIVRPYLPKIQEKIIQEVTQIARHGGTYL